MRLSKHLLPLLLLVLLPVHACCQGWGLLKVLLSLAALGALREALLLRTVFSRAQEQKREEETGRVRVVLETQPPSHYVEKVNLHIPTNIFNKKMFFSKKTNE